MSWRRPMLASLLVCSWLGLLTWNESQWLTQATDLAWLAKDSVKTVAQVGVWIAGWAWVTHVQQGTPRLSAHICIAMAASVLDVAVLQVLLPGLFFALAWPWPLGFYKLLWTPLVLLAALLHLHVAANGLRARQLGGWLLAAALTLGLSNVQAWAERNDREAIKKLPYEPNLYPASWLVSAPPSLDAGLKSLWSGEWTPVSPEN